MKILLFILLFAQLTFGQYFNILNWVKKDGATIVARNVFTTTSVGGGVYNDFDLEIGATYAIRVKWNTTAGSFAIYNSFGIQDNKISDNTANDAYLFTAKSKGIYLYTSEGKTSIEHIDLTKETVVDGINWSQMELLSYAGCPSNFPSANVINCTYSLCEGMQPYATYVLSNDFGLQSGERYLLSMETATSYAVVCNNDNGRARIGWQIMSDAVKNDSRQIFYSSTRSMLSFTTTQDFIANSSYLTFYLFAEYVSKPSWMMNSFKIYDLPSNRLLPDPGAYQYPILLFPVSGATDISVEPTFVWGASSYFTEYQLQVASDVDFNYLVKSTTVIDTTYILNRTLARNTTYYWRIRGRAYPFDLAYSDWAASSFLTVPNIPGQIATGIYPIPSSNNISISFTFLWSSALRATSYELAYRKWNETSWTYITNILSPQYAISGLDYNTTYYWKVRGINSGGAGSWLQERYFITMPEPDISVPDIPQLLFPASNATGIPVAITLDWLAAAGATSYDLQVSTSINFTSTIINQTGLLVTEYAVTGLQNDKGYFWRVRATNVNGSSNWNKRFFKTIAETPAAGVPVLIEPTNGLTNVSLTPTLKWGVVSGAVSYDLQVSTVETFTSTVISQTGLTGITYNVVSGLSNNTRYYWRVRSINGGTSAWSTVWSFTTLLGTPSSVPTLVLPVNNATGLAVVQKLVWTAVEGASYYYYEIDDDIAFGSAITGNTAKAEVVKSFQKGIKYYWKVKAVNLSGQGDFSTVSNFTTIPNLPSQVTLVSPASASNGNLVNTTLTWNAATGATTYELEISGLVTETISDIVGVTYDLIGLNKNTSYFWRVRAVNIGGNGAWSEMWYFNTETAVSPLPSKVILLSPTSNTVILASPSPVLQWQVAINASTYTIELKKGSDQSITTITGVAVTNYNSLTLSAGESYFWKVKGVNSSGSGQWSDTWYFNTTSPELPPDPVLPYIPVLVSPVNLATDVAVDTDITWEVAANATSYDVQVSLLSNFTTTLVSHTAYSAGLFYTLSLNNAETYWWRIRGRNADGVSGWATRSFTTIAVTPAVPSAPTLTFPANDTTGININTTLLWDSVGSVTWEVQVAYDTDFNIFLVSSTEQSNARYKLPRLGYEIKYYWRVRAKNAGGYSAWSAVWNFTTLVAPEVTEFTCENGVVITEDFTGNTYDTVNFELRGSAGDGVCETYFFSICNDRLEAQEGCCATESKNYAGSQFRTKTISSVGSSFDVQGRVWKISSSGNRSSMVGIWADSNHYVGVAVDNVYTTDGTVSLIIHNGGGDGAFTYVFNTALDITDANLYRVTYDRITDEVNFYYDSTGIWVQLGTTQVVDFGSTQFYGGLFFGVFNASAGTDAYGDDLYVCYCPFEATVNVAPSINIVTPVQGQIYSQDSNLAIAWTDTLPASVIQGNDCSPVFIPDDALIEVYIDGNEVGEVLNDASFSYTLANLDVGSHEVVVKLYQYDTTSQEIVSGVLDESQSVFEVIDASCITITNAEYLSSSSNLNPDSLHVTVLGNKKGKLKFFYYTDNWYEWGTFIKTDGEYYLPMGKEHSFITEIKAETVIDSVAFTIKNYGSKELWTGNVICTYPSKWGVRNSGAIWTIDASCGWVNQGVCRGGYSQFYFYSDDDTAYYLSYYNNSDGIGYLDKDEVDYTYTSVHQCDFDNFETDLFNWDEQAFGLGATRLYVREGVNTTNFPFILRGWYYELEEYTTNDFIQPRRYRIKGTYDGVTYILLEGLGTYSVGGWKENWSQDIKVFYGASTGINSSDYFGTITAGAIQLFNALPPIPEPCEDTFILTDTIEEIVSPKRLFFRGIHPKILRY